MARNHQEYARNRKVYGAWNYQTNKKGIDRFFREGIERMKGKEEVVTIAMRGDGDAPMGPDTDTKLLENIVYTSFLMSPSELLPKGRQLCFMMET